MTRTLLMLLLGFIQGATLAQCIFQMQEEAEVGTPSLRQGDRDSGLPSGERELTRPT
jgi:hypothetical protein